MMAFPLAPVAYAEGKPGNVLFYDRSRTGPGSGFNKNRTWPDSFAGRSRLRQGNPVRSTGEAVEHSAYLDGRPAACQHGPGNGPGEGGPAVGEPRRAGARFAGQRDGGSPAQGAR